MNLSTIHVVGQKVYRNYIDSYQEFIVESNEFSLAAAVGLLSCATLSTVAISGLVLGSISLTMSIICCAHRHCFKLEGPTLRCLQCLCCSAVLLLTVTFLAALIANTVFVAQNINFINDPAGLCSSTEVAPAVMGLSYSLLPMFGLFCLWSTYTFWCS